MVKGDRSEEKRYEEKGKLWIFNKIADAEMVLSGKVYQLGYSVNYYGCTYYGSLDHEGDYDLYVFYPSDEVFHLRNIALFYGISLYAVFSIL